MTLCLFCFGCQTQPKEIVDEVPADINELHFMRQTHLALSPPVKKEIVKPWTAADEAKRKKEFEQKEAEDERAWKQQMLRLSKLRDSVSAKNIRLGMTVEQVRAKFEPPKDINRNVGPWGVHEQWVYQNDYYLYFENGILTSWQN